jgi:hypothetical protein
MPTTVAGGVTDVGPIRLYQPRPANRAMRRRSAGESPGSSMRIASGNALGLEPGDVTAQVTLAAFINLAADRRHAQDE